MTKDYLLEIGVEELPAAYINNAEKQLKNLFIKALDENKIKYKDIINYQSPRRLAILVKDLATKQDDITETQRGPKLNIAYDENKNPTKALEGFMKSKGVSLNDLEIKDDYIYATINKKGQATADILAQNISQIIKNINFPKNMKWGGKEIRFARPIRYIVSLFGDEVLNFDFEGIKVSNITKGHRFLGSSHIEIKNPLDYEELLKENYVIVDPNKRKEIIKYDSEKLAKEVGGEILPDEGLLEELTNIVEYPTPVMGRIKDEYLTLPNEVITTPMRDHLRFIPVYKSETTLLPYFITIVNGTDEYKDIIIKGNEKVLQARLEDAKFFYQEDLKKPLEDYVKELNGIVFHDKLGNLEEKSQRIAKLGEKIGETLEIAPEAIENLLRAAKLSKADLLTNMVNEFTELQGKMGMIYAEKSGENQLTSQAIYEQYLPAFSKDKLPQSTAGAILSIADKADTICGLFSIDEKPSGSQDPFALRRAALGIIRILLDNKWDISIEKLIDYALYLYVDENNLVFDYDSTKASIMQFFNSRIKVILLDQGIRYDIADAVLVSNSDSLIDIFAKADALNKFFTQEEAKKVAEAFTRLHNLAVKAEANDFVGELMAEEEKNLFDKFQIMRETVEQKVLKRDYEEAFEDMKSLVEPINHFFDNVMIMVEDEKIRNNRLAFIKSIDDFIIDIIDFSKIIN
ncbi:MAG: glycine--tRNA ligase subunit beta [Tissierellia bacterium]|nr:glycine--tRNA ligase subunit beta [Tissierellia bacterium]